MKTRQQKMQEMKISEELLEKSRNLIFVDFGKVAMQEVNSLKKKLKESGGKFKVIKKRLLKIIFRSKQIDFDPKANFKEQLGIIFSPADIAVAAKAVNKFSDKIKVLGIYDLEEKRFLGEDIFKKIALLPPREILLAQLAGVLSAPIKMFLYILNEKSKQTVENKKF